MNVYRDMAMRRAEIDAFERQKFLVRRRLSIRDPFSCIGASFAIAGAAALSRTTLSSLDACLDLLALGNQMIDTARAFTRAFGFWRL